MENIKIYNPNDKPFGLLSNNSYHPILIDGKKYSTVTNYIFSNMLVNPTNKIILQNAEITGSKGINKELINAIDYLLTNISTGITHLTENNELEVGIKRNRKEIAESRNRVKKITFLVKNTKKDKDYYEKQSNEYLDKYYNKILKDIPNEDKQVAEHQKNIEEQDDIEKAFETLAEVDKEDREKRDKYKNYIANQVKIPFESIDLKQLKQKIIYEADLNKIGIYKLMDVTIDKELYEIIFKAINDGFMETILGENIIKDGDNIKKELKSPEIKNALMSTGNRSIQYESPDQFLGIGTEGKGLNIVGKVLMQIRHSIKYKEVHERKQNRDDINKKNIYEVYIAYTILMEEMYKNKNNLIEYLGLTYEEIIKKYDMARIINGVQSQEIVMKMYNNCSLNEIVIKEINQPGNLVINIRKLGLRDLRESLLLYKNEIAFNLYLEYMLKNNFNREILTETSRLYNIKKKLKSTDIDRKKIMNEIIQHSINKQLSKYPPEDIEKLKERIVNLFNLKKLSKSLLNDINSAINKLEIPTNKEIDEAEMIEIPVHVDSPKSKCFDNDLNISENSNENSDSEENVKESDDMAKYIKTILKSDKQSKKLINNLISINGGNKEDYKNMSVNELKKQIKKEEEKKDEEEENIGFTKQIGIPLGIFTDDNNNPPEYRPFNPLFYTGMLNINGKNYPTIQHYMITKLIAGTGTKIVHNTYTTTYVKGMGINNAHRLILIDNPNLNKKEPYGNEPHHYKNIQSISQIYNEQEKEANKILTSLLAVTALNKKFEDIELQNLLLTTGDSIIEWDSPYARYPNLIVGTDKIKGFNYVGLTMMGIREKLKEIKKEEEKIFIQEEDINKFIQSDTLVKSWLIMRTKDMCETINKLQQYLKLKNKFDYDLQHETPLIKLINFSLDNIYQPCKYLISLAKENETTVPSFIVDIVSKCSGMSSGEPPIQIVNNKGIVLYNKEIQETINNNARQITDIENEFWGINKTQHSKEESLGFEDHQRNEFHQLWIEMNASDISSAEKNKKLDILQKDQREEYNEFWGIKTIKKSKDDFFKHEHNIKELKKELSNFLLQAKNKEKHYSFIIKEIAQIYWNRLSAMLSVLIQNVSLSTDSNIRKILTNIQLLNSEKTNCEYIISNEEDNCIVSAILNLMTGILIFKKEFSSTHELDIDDVKLAGSIIINNKLQAKNISYEEEESDEKSQIDSTDDELDKNPDENDDYGEVENNTEDEDENNNLEENPYFGFKQGSKNKKSITEKTDIQAMENKILLMSKNTQNSKEIVMEIIKMVDTIKNSKMSQKIKQNRINFFSTIR